MLERGFTTVRDAGGADWGLRQAVADGLIVGPRLFVSGRALSPTGGAADIYRRSVEHEAAGDGESPFVSVADGRDGFLRAARAELSAGADQLTVAISGGNLSRIEAFDTARCTLGELEAVVHEAEAWQRPVSALAHGDHAVSLAVKAGFRSVMHGTMLGATGAAFMAEQGVTLVPTLEEHHALRERAQALGREADARDVAKALQDAAGGALGHAVAAGVEIGFGSAQWGASDAQQGREWVARSELMEAYDVLVSATDVNARILGMEGELGIVAPGAIADLLIVDGDPLRDARLLGTHGRHLALIMRDGRIHRNRLETVYRQAAVVPAGPPMG
jgi:imidazolonepropionase-like amidohydrolase